LSPTAREVQGPEGRRARRRAPEESLGQGPETRATEPPILTHDCFPIIRGRRR
jgi:hypothetical protein